MLELILFTWIVIIVIMLLGWSIAALIKNPGVIDVFWAINIVVAGLCFSSRASHHAMPWIVRGLLIAWGVRLAAYLIITRIIPKLIDPRYTTIMASWKGHQQWGYALHFQFQGILALVIAVPFLMMNNANGWLSLQVIGTVTVVIGLMGEILADHQLTQFKRAYPKAVCDSGLWAYSRHPNCFFEWLIWVGFAITMLSYHWGWIALVSPIAIALIMLKLTIPITEKGSLTRKGDDYRRYQERTPCFFPIKPRKDIR